MNTADKCRPGVLGSPGSVHGLFSKISPAPRQRFTFLSLFTVMEDDERFFFFCYGGNWATLGLTARLGAERDKLETFE